MKKIKLHELSYQVGNVIKICKEPQKVRRTGFYLNSEHLIQKPPENHINSQMGIWVNDKNGKIRYLQFMYWSWTGRTNKVIRTRTK